MIMKTIKNLTVKMTYYVGLSHVQVSDEIYEALSKCYDNGREINLDSFDNEDQIASEWLQDHICEADAMDWEYDIEDFE